MDDFIRCPPALRVLRNKRILVVEDEALVAMLVEDELRDVGAKVVGPAMTLTEALQIVEAEIENGGISAAVLDLNLGGESSLPVADKLIKLGVPFVFETGYDDEFNVARYKHVPILRKPYDPQRLVEALASVVAVQRSDASASR